MTAPTNVSVPVILGRLAVGDEIVCTLGDWTGRPRTFAPQWRMNGINFGSSDIKAIVPIGWTSSDAITVAVAATNQDGTTTAISAAADASAWTTQDITTDGGAKTLTAVGSISIGTPRTLTLTSNPGFVAGDPIIVEIGGEAGAGVRGTMGVGGAWPGTSYANRAAFPGSATEGTYVWALDTGNVWQYTSGAWLDTTTRTDLYGYYIEKANPLSLRTTVASVAGDVLTLSASGPAATVSTTNANVYFDCQPVLAPVFDSTFTGNYRKWTCPSGRFAMGDFMLIFRSNFILHGAGSANTVFFTPRGVPGLSMGPYVQTKALLRDIGFEGNLGANGTGFDYSADPTLTPQVPDGVKLNGNTSSIMLRCAGLNTVRFLSVDVATDSWVYDSDLVLTEQVRAYNQWQYGCSDSVGGGFLNCTFTAPYLTAAFEIFRCNRSRMLNCGGQNALHSVNGSGDFLVYTPSATLLAASQPPSVSLFTPILVVGNAIGNTEPYMALGGEVVNPSLIQQGRVDTANKTSLQSITNSLNNVNIEGTYPTCTNPKGLISCPDYVAGSPISDLNSLGIYNEGSGVTVRGLRFVGLTNYPTVGNIHGIGGGVTITNCVMDHPATGAFVTSETGTMTYAEYLANCAGLRLIYRKF